MLKSPGHLWCLGALLDEYPTALLVQTHRDPLRIIYAFAHLAHERAAPLSAPTTSLNPTLRPRAFADYLLSGLDRSVGGT